MLEIFICADLTKCSGLLIHFVGNETKEKKKRFDFLKGKSIRKLQTPYKKQILDTAAVSKSGRHLESSKREFTRMIY